jgi:hypothetical protein
MEYGTMKTWADYQKKAMKTAIYKEKIIYPTLGLVDESSEFFYSIGQKGQLKELGDCFWYVSALTYDIQSDINSIYDEVAEMDPVFVNIKDAAINMITTAAKICGIVKKWRRDEETIEPSDDKIIAIEFELVSYMESVNYICKEFGVQWQDVAQLNLDKLFDRKKRGKIKGSGDNR